jgi:hypothetical protein
MVLGLAPLGFILVSVALAMLVWAYVSISKRREGKGGEGRRRKGISRFSHLLEGII